MEKQSPYATVVSFSVQRNEYEKALEFMRSCEEELPTPQTAIGGRYSWSFGPTTLGCNIVIFDSLLNKELNITDFDS